MNPGQEIYILSVSPAFLEFSIIFVKKNIVSNVIGVCVLDKHLPKACVPRDWSLDDGNLMGGA